MLSKQMMYNVNLVDAIVFAVIIVGHLQCRITRNGILGLLLGNYLGALRSIFIVVIRKLNKKPHCVRQLWYK